MLHNRLSRRNQIARLDALLADHASLLQASARSLELLNELNGLARQSWDMRQERDETILREVAFLRERFERLVTDWKQELLRREAASLEELASVQSRVELMSSDWDSKLGELERRLNEEREFSAERLKSLAAEIRSNPADFGLRNPEVGLMTHLYSYLPVTTAIDVGANRGEITERLLDAGYEVYAFEPYPPAFEELQTRLRGRGGRAYALAVGSTNAAMKLHVAEDRSADGKYRDPAQLSSLVLHSMPSDLPFVTSVDVTVRSLESLAAGAMIPRDVAVLKIDTEGYDLEVIRGMGDLHPHVLVSEYWAADFVFGQSGALNRLDELVREARARGYRWYIVLYRLAGSDRISYYCNYDQSVSNSWGNVFFFQDRELFLHAMEWCVAVLPTTYFNSVAAVNHLSPLQNLTLAVPQSRNGEAAGGALRGSHGHTASNGAIAGFNVRLDQLGRLISIRSEEIAQFRAEAAARDRSLNSLIAVVARLETALARPEVGGTPQTPQMLSSDSKSFRQRVHELGQTLADKDVTLNRLQDRVRRMKRSYSWKITSPLREIRRVGERIGRYVAGHDHDPPRT